ncbi:NADP-dependent aldehyde dehydrogenase [Chitinophaga ginsengisoli]|uniref:NADP-dependent aldehyde dehydrogenase n=2 Tax=Chitinophaga ginsengisoli TaxID=363837 RepID=A0A2P8FDZ0_9BACT|nr:aldehyde dehydrogenase (NADP(+)) [Chitinophaga ginsengisoli]PSL19931.1 NADP-dependent aldehyde dehydrogenase [Chitinophaga ginsengisoli]
MQIDDVMQRSAEAFAQYRELSPSVRAAFLETIASEIAQVRDMLVETAQAESNLPAARLNGEITRTTSQLQMFANLIKEGSWVEAVIDTAKPDSTPAKPDLRRMLVPAGPVVVFGASNFPFAFSTAGGDTASALAAGATVVIKGHPAHPRTSLAVFEAMQKAISKSGMPAFTVQHVTGEGNAVGKALVTHPLTTGVGFTGSLQGGKALLGYAAEREVPIPVFAEMSSINPVVFYPDALATQAEQLAQTFAGSVTLGMGQFCTNPGLLIGLKSAALDNFVSLLGNAIAAVAPQKMLHKGICEAYGKGRKHMLAQQDVVLVNESAAPADMEAWPSLARTTGKTFLGNPHLKEELFGPFSLLVECEDKAELLAVLKSLHGQLTTTIVGTAADTAQWKDVIAVQSTLAGRVILNNPPTGVEVCAAMVHGGPFPATSDQRFTSVGTGAIRRWVRPVCYQNFPEEMLPDALKAANPLGIWRQIDNQFTR